MTFTAGLLLVFLNVFLSGLIFLRFYFIGEFSKQFNTRVPIVRLAFYALIPGLAILSIGIWTYTWCDANFSLSGALKIYVDLLSSEGKFNKATETFLDSQIDQFVYFNLLSYAGAAFFGFLIHYLIRKIGLDKSFKLFRFKNTWYYIFSGEIMKFKKFLEAHPRVELKGIEKNEKARVTYADILCNENGQTKLYTGYVVDYELDQDNMHHLDRIYLLDAIRYDRKLNPSKIQGTFSRKEIQGHLFVVDYRNVVNLNLTYVPSENKRNAYEERKFHGQFKWVFYIAMIAALAIIVLIWINIIPNSYSKVNKVFLSLSILGISNAVSILLGWRSVARKLETCKSEFKTIIANLKANKGDQDVTISELKKVVPLNIRIKQLTNRSKRIKQLFLSSIIGSVIYLILFLIF